MRKALLIALLVGALGAVLGQPGMPSPPKVPERLAPLPLPRISPAAVDRQDRVTDEHRRRESEAFDRRPLLRRLPLRRDRVTIDISGLASDDRRTVISIDPGRRTRAHARATFGRVLARSGDRRANYVLRWVR